MDRPSFRRDHFLPMLPTFPSLKLGGFNFYRNIYEREGVYLKLFLTKRWQFWRQFVRFLEQDLPFTYLNT